MNTNEAGERLSDRLGMPKNAEAKTLGGMVLECLADGAGWSLEALQEHLRAEVHPGNVRPVLEHLEREAVVERIGHRWHLLTLPNPTPAPFPAFAVGECVRGRDGGEEQAGMTIAGIWRNEQDGEVRYSTAGGVLWAVDELERVPEPRREPKAGEVWRIHTRACWLLEDRYQGQQLIPVDIEGNWVWSNSTTLDDALTLEAIGAEFLFPTLDAYVAAQAEKIEVKIGHPELRHLVAFIRADWLADIADVIEQVCGEASALPIRTVVSQARPVALAEAQAVRP